MQNFDREISRFFKRLAPINLSVVHLGFQKNVLKKKGFGYLIPSLEKEAILGVIFDSQVFPQQSKKEGQTRLSVIIKEPSVCSNDLLSKEERINLAVRKVQNHLKINDWPCLQKVINYPEALPQFFVGHEKKVAFLQAYLKTHYPRLTFLGNYLEGISVSDCIALAEKIALSFS